MKKLILILLIITALTEGCKKYEDGPWISFRSPLKRLYGVYTLTQYNVNGYDSLTVYNDSLGLIFEIYYDDVNSYNVLKIGGNRKDGHYYPVLCKWELINKNTILKIKTSYAYTGIGPFGNNITPEWTITHLTNKEVSMKTNYYNCEYSINLDVLN